MVDDKGWVIRESAVSIKETASLREALLHHVMTLRYAILAKVQLNGLKLVVVLRMFYANEKNRMLKSRK